MSVVSWPNMQENNMSLGLFMDQTEVINEPVDQIWLICATCVLTTMVNISAIRVHKQSKITA